MQIRTFYGSKSIGVLFLLYDSGDKKAPVCEIWSFNHNKNTSADFWTLAPLLSRHSVFIVISIRVEYTIRGLYLTG